MSNTSPEERIVKQLREVRASIDRAAFPCVIRNLEAEERRLLNRLNALQPLDTNGYVIFPGPLPSGC